MSSIALFVDVNRTTLVCTWSLVDNTDFDTITGQVLTYTDLSHNSWISQQVSASGTPDAYEEQITGLDEETDYKVYVTVIGKKNGVRVVKASNVVYRKTDANRANPVFTLLSGKDYLQLVFWEPGHIPTTTYGSPDAIAYDFEESDIQSFMISVNNLTTQTDADSESTAPSVMSKTVANDVKTYVVTDPNGNTYTYHYILITGLAENSNYEVAVTYLTDVDILPILPLSATVQRETKEAVNEGAAPSYALNTVDTDNNVGESVSIDVVWRAAETKVVTDNDTQADIPPASASIQRQKYDEVNEVWVDDGAAVNHTASADSSGNYIHNETNTNGLIVGALYKYKIDMKDAEGVVITSTTTNNVRALKNIAVSLSSTDIELNASTGGVRLNTTISSILTLDDGFVLAEFANRSPYDDQFRLKYTIDGVVAYKPITVDEATGIATSEVIERTAEKSITVALEVNPSHETLLIPTIFSNEVSAYSRSFVTSSAVTLYNTTLPGAVEDFVYKNTQFFDETQGSGKLILTWSPTDSASNPNAEDFYIVKVTDTTASPNTDYTIVLAPPSVTLSEYPTRDQSDYYIINDGFLAYEVTRTTGHAYTATIQRVYIYNTVTLAANANVVGHFLYGDINTGGQALIQFLNPPTPVVSSHSFNDSTNILTFNVAHGTATYGFTESATYFEITLTKDGENQTIAVEQGEGTNGAGTNSINMSSIGASGDDFILHVRAFVTTKYESTSANTENFYSVEHTFEFRKLSGLAAPATVVSSKDGVAGTHMKIEWTKVTNAVAASFDPAAIVYYILEVTGTDNNSDTVYLVAPEHYPVNETRKLNMFGSNALPDNHDEYVKDTLTNFSYIYTGCVVGYSYTYSITARYFAPDIANYVVSAPTETGRALLAFSALPTPVALIDVESNGEEFNFEMAYNATNNSGVLDASLNFEYIELDATAPHDLSGNPVDLNEGENPEVLVSSFSQTIAPGDIIPVGFRTYYYTFANSTDVATTKYTSALISNFAINPVKFTLLPQIKKINVSYEAGNALIRVDYEKNGTLFGQAHVVTQLSNFNYTQVNLTGTHDENTVDETASGIRVNDHSYGFTVPDVAVNGLFFVSFAGHVASGLVVAHMADNDGLLAGNYVPQALYSKVFVRQA
jgi:hypothetical protein